MATKVYELIIIGAGPAGITASVYAARKQLDFLVITKDIGGQAALSGDIENYTGYQFISGPELALKFEEHLRKFAIELRESEEVKQVSRKNDLLQVVTDKGSYFAHSAIVASGKRSRELGIPGEIEFKNRGVTYCATCDGPLFKDKRVAVIGGGNSALDATISLLKIASKIYIVNISSGLTADPVMQEKVKNSGKVEIFNNSKVIEILGDKFVNGLRIRTPQEEKVLPVEGIFVEIGLIPNSEFIEIVEKNELGEIKVDSYNQTSGTGIFAAGDVTDVPEKQIIIAAGEGSKALLSAFRYLNTFKKSKEGK